MVCVGIDVAKDKHDCCILDSEGTTLVDCFTIPNNMDGFKSLLQTIQDCSQKSDKIKVGLEATGHYSYNILGFLLDNDLPVYVMNPLHTNLYRKSLSLRKTKTDRVDAKTIATMLLSDVDLKSYTDTAYHNEELKSLTRYRFDKVQERAKLKQSVSRLVTILFPELEQLVSSIHGTSIYALLSEYPGAKQISEAHLTRLANILVKTSRGHYRKDKATHIRDTARTSIGSVMPAKSLELKHTIKLIQELTSEINEIEDAIRKIMDELKPPILSIPGMGFHSAAMILAEVGDFRILTLLTKFWLMLDVLPPHTSQENSQTAMHTWKSVALVIFDTLFTLQPNTSVTGILFLLNTLPKSKLKASTTMLPYLMPQRNSYD